jgi:hypothetical protein
MLCVNSILLLGVYKIEYFLTFSYKTESFLYFTTRVYQKQMINASVHWKLFKCWDLHWNLQSFLLRVKHGALLQTLGKLLFYINNLCTCSNNSGNHVTPWKLILSRFAWSVFHKLHMNAVFLRHQGRQNDKRARGPNRFQRALLFYWKYSSYLFK